MTEEARRAAVCAVYDGRCGYCTVHESKAGTELEIDHFQPRSLRGSDDLDNLCYCCTACNRLKGDFWPATDPLITTRRLLHPKRDNLTDHLCEELDGRMVALTATGAASSFSLSRSTPMASRWSPSLAAPPRAYPRSLSPASSVRR